MKVVKMNPANQIKVTEKMIVAILKKDFNAFKATSKQFLRNNEAYFSAFSGMIA